MTKLLFKSMGISRKSFIVGLGSAALVPSVSAVDDTILLKIGILTDTHFGGGEDTGFFERGWRLFREEGCQMVAHVGDIADRYYPDWYKKVCDVRTRVFGDLPELPQEVWVFAGHDWVDMPCEKTLEKLEKDGYPLLRDALKIPHPAFHSFSCAGFEFVVFPQLYDESKMKKMLDAAFARSKPGHPVFLFDHSAGYDTTEGSHMSGLVNKRKLYADYPQLIHISGHSHGSLYNEQNIHQGEYTTVSAGCLTYFGTPGIGIPRDESSDGHNRSVMVMELHATHATFRRYSLASGVEIGADEPWIVSWPYDPQHPRYSVASQRRRHAIPEFGRGAKLEVAVATGTTKTLIGEGEHLSLTFPIAPSRFVQYYRVEAFRKDAQGAREQILMRDVLGDYWKEPEARRLWMTHDLDAAFFVSGEPIEVTVRPVDFWGNVGRPLVWSGRAPTDACREVWSGELQPFKGHPYALPPLPAAANGKRAKVVVTVEANRMAPGGVFFGVRSCDFRFLESTVTPHGHSRLTYVLRLSGKVAPDKRYEFAFAMYDHLPYTIKFTDLRVLVE